MKERPIIFSAPMIHAILEGRKTQTRRIIKRDGGLLAYAPRQCVMEGWWMPTTPSGKISTVPGIPCPYGIPGDRLWVREAFIPDPVRDGSWEDYSGDFKLSDIPDEYRNTKHVIYKADCDWAWKWRSPIHIPRWASRITLEVTGVQVERVQDISGADAIAEGIDPMNCYGPGCKSGPDGCNARGCHGCRDAYATLWDKINGKKPGGDWEANPFVWCIEFKVLEVQP